MAIVWDSASLDHKANSQKKVLAVTTATLAGVVLVSGQVALVGVALNQAGGPTAVNGVTDTLGNTWALQGSVQTTTEDVELWVSTISVGGTSTITISFSQPAAIAMSLEQYAGVEPPLATSGVNSGTGTAAAVSSTTAANNAWIVGVVGTGTSVTFTAGANTNQRDSAHSIGSGANASIAASDSGNVPSSGSLVILHSNLSLSEPWTYLAFEMDPAPVKTVRARFFAHA